jgi:hypothetical protein
MREIKEWNPFWKRLLILVKSLDLYKATEVLSEKIVAEEENKGNVDFSPLLDVTRLIAGKYLSSFTDSGRERWILWEKKIEMFFFK